jgi:pSer/pThr/pTyr-binding forkhead associated (FHA) protein
MSDYIGIVCGSCDAFNEMSASACSACGASLVNSAGSPGASSRRVEEPMEQARNFICQECSSPVPSGHKFCGSCGAPVPDSVQSADTAFFSPMQDEGKARLVLVRGEGGVEGLTYVIASDEYVAGRDEGEILFPDDRFVSAKHATFRYEGDGLVVVDEGSENGVYARVTLPVKLSAGDVFLAGEQLFRLEGPVPDAPPAGADGTLFYGSPIRPSSFRVVQILEGGVEGMVTCARGESCVIGREEADLNFPLDIFMSRNHSRVSVNADGTFRLEDLDSRNGTYVKVAGRRSLVDGDFLFLGRELLRVELA